MHAGAGCLPLGKKCLSCKTATHARLTHAGCAGPPTAECDLLHRMRAGALSAGAIHLEEASPKAVAAGISTDSCQVRERASKTQQWDY